MNVEPGPVAAAQAGIVPVGRLFRPKIKRNLTPAQLRALSEGRRASRLGYAREMLSNNEAIAKRIGETAKQAAQAVVSMRNPNVPKDQRITLSEACAQAGLGTGKANELAHLVKQEAETAKLQATCLTKEARKLSGKHKKKVSPAERIVRLKVEGEKMKKRSDRMYAKAVQKGWLTEADNVELTAEAERRFVKWVQSSIAAEARAKARGKVVRMRRNRTPTQTAGIGLMGL